MPGTSMNTFPWVDRRAKRRAKKRRMKARDSMFATTIPLTLTPLPMWEHLSPIQRRIEAKEILRSANEVAAQKREGQGVLGVEKILRQKPDAIPNEVKTSPRPLCHASTKEARMDFKVAYCSFVDAFAHASKRLRSGAHNVCFPPEAFRPPLPFDWMPRAVT